MIQTLLLLLAPAQQSPELPSEVARPLRLMATRLPSCGAHKRHPGWRERAARAAVIVGNACGFALFLMVLGWLLRVAEVLLN
jgi:hypothetical protein